ncbi:hypothetical protein ABZY16_15930 [Streptomyces sp. NPDC006553]
MNEVRHAAATAESPLTKPWGFHPPKAPTLEQFGPRSWDTSFLSEDEVQY